MKNKVLYLFLSGLITISCSTPEVNQSFTSYCNPSNIDYDFAFGPSRHASDPTVILFKNKYYLFTSWDFDGYRVSDDLINWKRIHFSPENREDAMLVSPSKYTAAAVATDGDYLYYCDYNTSKNRALTPILRTNDPDSGKWEKCGEIKGKPADPCIYIEDGRFWLYQGLGPGNPISVIELNSEMKPVGGSHKVLRPKITDVNQCDGGYHLGRRELMDELDAKDWVGKFSMLPCPEGAWMTKYKDMYYLQLATPGTVGHWYCDVLMEGDNPDGPFVEVPYNPVSMKVGGFMGSSGHSSVFQDRYGNYWRYSTMWIGTLADMERRIGLFPVTFDKEGRMKTHTIAGDWPMPIPQKKFNPKEYNIMGWYPLSYNKQCTASSTDKELLPELASDENCRTHWSAKSGDKGEWFVMDLGHEMKVRALQINFADVDFKRNAPSNSDYHAYILYHSKDGKQWNVIVDKTLNRKAVPHDYIELTKDLDTRYIKIENIHTPREGKFALLDLRVFGNAGGKQPQKVNEVKALRLQDDSRCAEVSWKEVDDAEGYFVRFGYQPDFLNQAIQVKAGETTRLTLHTLIKNQKYYYQIDTYNSSGITFGDIIEETVNK